MFDAHFSLMAIFSMVMVAAVPAATQSQDMAAADPGEEALQFLVTLPVKASHLDGFLATMHREVAGARAEPGNLAFDVYEDGARPGTLYLFEHWKSEAALDAHTHQSYYKAIRAQEADDLGGPVDERNLREIMPSKRGKPSDARVPGGYSALTLLRTTNDTGSQLVDLFGPVAPQARASAGNKGFSLFQDIERPQAFVLIEHWSQRSAREVWMNSADGQAFQSWLQHTAAAPAQPIDLIDRSR